MTINRHDQFRHPFTGGCHRLHDRRPCPDGAQGQHRAELVFGFIGAGQVRLVDHENVGDFQDSRLECLDVVTRPRRTHNDSCRRDASDLYFRLTGTDRLDDHIIETRGVEHRNDIARRSRQAAKMSARGKRANEYARFALHIAHSHPIAEHGPTADGARRIDRNHRDRSPAREQRLAQHIDQRRFPRARRTRDADDARVAARLRQCGRQRQRIVRPILDRRDRTRDCAPVTAADARERVRRSIVAIRWRFQMTTRQTQTTVSG